MKYVIQSFEQHHLLQNCVSFVTNTFMRNKINMFPMRYCDNEIHTMFSVNDASASLINSYATTIILLNHLPRFAAQYYRFP